MDGSCVRWTLDGDSISKPKNVDMNPVHGEGHQHHRVCMHAMVLVSADIDIAVGHFRGCYCCTWVQASPDSSPTLTRDLILSYIPRQQPNLHLHVQILVCACFTLVPVGGRRRGALSNDVLF